MIVVVVVRWRLILLGFLVLFVNVYNEFPDENRSKWKVACVASRGL